jgi:hypothetical protein
MDPSDGNRPYFTSMATPYTTFEDDVMFTSAMDLISFDMLDSSIPQNGIPSAMNMQDSIWTYDGFEQPGSGVSTPFFADLPWSTGAGNHPANYQSQASEYYESLLTSDQGHSYGSNDNNPREHALYKKATTGPDGLYHCPWEGKDRSCNHKPEKLKCNYE